MNILNELSKLRKKANIKKTYTSDSLILKVLKPNEAQLVLEYYLRNKEFLENWEPARGRNFYTYEYQQEILKGEYLEFKEKSKLRLWIHKKNEREKVIGS